MSLQMQKKSQISIFMIIGIVLIVIGGLIFAVYSGKQEPEPAQVSQFAAVNSYIEDCIKNRAEYGLSLLGLQGGIIVLRDPYLETNYSSIAYGIYQRQNTLPAISSMERELKTYLDKSLPSCLNSSAFPYLKFESGNASTQVEILENEVIVKADYPISILQGETAFTINEISVKVPARLGYIHSILRGIISRTLLEPNWIDLSYLSRFDLKIDVLPHDNNSIVYSIQDYKGAKPYVFLSALDTMQNFAPVINEEDKIELLDGQLFLKKLDITDPEGDNVECYDDTALFDITNDCVILFTPEIPGYYDVRISAADAAGNSAY